MKGFGGQKANRNKALHASYIDVNSIKNSNTEYFLSTVASNQSLNDSKANLAELNIIHKLAERKDLFPLLIKSVCPSIYGNELVKVGLVLSLFGGTDYRLKNKGGVEEFGDLAMRLGDERAGEEEDDDKAHPTIRPDVHLLMVGDPGLGKSQMLKHIINVAPRGVYVCGNSTTNAGLTATLIRDNITNEQNLEAGALVLSDLGVCCIDEFDKMSSDQHTLLEAMEQQTISIAKGGILGSLSARCSIVACANPATGHYNRSRSILDNIRISNAILSRFDLVFLMLDDPDLDRDKMLSEHVMRQHAKGNKKRRFGETQSVFPGSSFIEESILQKRGPMSQSSVTDEVEAMYDPTVPDKASLVKKVQILTQAIPESEVIEPHLLKKFISYAKHMVFPKLSIEACEILKDFYIQLRENSTNNPNSLPVTSRQLDSLIRLSQARAKLELRSIVTRQDSIDVVKLVQESLFEACYMDLSMPSESGPSYNTQRGGAGPRKGQGLVDPNNVSMLSIPKQTRVFVDKLRGEGQQKGSGQFDY